MNINQLEYLVKATECGSYAEAAKLLFVSPQAVSKAITDLEKELHLQLFTKSGRGIVPTPNGIILAAKASEIVLCCKDLKNYAEFLLSDCHSRPTAKGSFKLAVSSSPFEGGVISSNYFDSFNTEHPLVELTVSYCSSGTGLTVLQDGLVDSAIILGRCKKEGYRCTKLFDCEMRVAVSNSHPLANARSVSFFELINYPIAKPNDLRYCAPLIEKLLMEHNYSAEPIQLAHNSDDRNHFFDKDHGIMFVLHEPELERLHPGMRYLQLAKEDWIEIPVCFICSESSETQISSLIQRDIIQQVKISKTGRI